MSFTILLLSKWQIKTPLPKRLYLLKDLPWGAGGCDCLMIDSFMRHCSMPVVNLVAGRDCELPIYFVIQIDTPSPMIMQFAIDEFFLAQT